MAMSFTALCMIIVHVLQVNSAIGRSYNSSSIRNSSSSGNPSRLSTATITSAPDACCFVVQDDFNVRYWATLTTDTSYLQFNATVHLTSITVFVDTTVKNIETKIQPTNSSSLYSYDIGVQNIARDDNLAPQPTLSQSMLNGTKVEIHGTTMYYAVALQLEHRNTDKATRTSPANFILYPSVKVLSVPAVTDKNGQRACVTTSIHPYEACSLDPSPVSSLQYSGMNSYAEAYYGDYANSSSFKQHVGQLQRPTKSRVAISFTTPFVYVPSTISYAAGKSATDISVSNRGGDVQPAIEQDEGTNENYGYVPQELIQWMASNPDYVSQYPDIASCLPGGPFIDLGRGGCVPAVPAAPGAALAASELTKSSQVTVTSAGCFHPGACEVHTAAAAPSALPANPGPKATAIPEIQSPSQAAPQASKSPNVPSIQSSEPIPVGNPSKTPTAASPNSLVIPAPQESQEQKASPASPQNTPTEKPDSASAASGATPTGGSDSLSAKTPFNPDDVSPDQLSVLHQALQPTSAGPVVQETSPIQSNPSPEEGSLSATAQANAASNQGGTNNAPQVQTPIQQPSLAALPFQSEGSANQPATLVQSQGLGEFIASAMGAQPVQQPPSAAGNTIQTRSGAQAENPQTFTVAIAQAASAIVVNGVTSTLAAIQHSFAAGAPVISIGSQSITLTRIKPTALFGQPDNPQNTVSQYIVQGQTISPGGQAVSIAGTPVSILPGGAHMIVGSSTIPVSPAIVGNALPPITLGSQIISPDSASAYVFGGQTLYPGSSAAVVSAPADQFNDGSAGAPAPVTIGSQVFTANPTAFVVGSSTLTPGGAGIIFSGTPISLLPSGSLVVGSSTMPLEAASSPALAPLSVGSQIFTPNPTAFPIAGTTLSAGGYGVTVAGTPISLLSAGDLVVGGSTIPLTSVIGESFIPSGTTITSKASSLASSTATESDSSGSTSGTTAPTPIGSNAVVSGAGSTPSTGDASPSRSACISLGLGAIVAVIAIVSL